MIIAPGTKTLNEVEHLATVGGFVFTLRLRYACSSGDHKKLQNILSGDCIYCSQIALWPLTVFGRVIDIILQELMGFGR